VHCDDADDSIGFSAILNTCLFVVQGLAGQTPSGFLEMSQGEDWLAMLKKLLREVKLRQA
jgi:hypothetical protein